MSVSSLDSFSRALLDLSLAGTLLLRPVYDDEQQEIIDFIYDYVNPAAQYMLRLPAEPTHTLLQNRPHLAEAGVLAFYREAYHANRASYYGVDFAYDGLDSYYQLAAQRQGELLLVSFTDTADRNRGSVEVALRESQTRERAARAEAERQRQALQRAFEQAPVAIAVYRGPRYIIELANPTVCRLWGRTAEQILGLGLFEALPEVAGMGYEELLDGVMATGQPYVAHAMPAVHEREGRRDTVYWDFVYVPMYETDGTIYGAMVVATEVTEQVETRQRAEQLTQELEARVAERTAQLAGQQRLLSQILRQAPAAIAAFSGPEHRYAFFNEPYRQLTDGRVQLGHMAAEVFPEAEAQLFLNQLNETYATGQLFSGTDLPMPLHDPAADQPVRYVDFVCQPLLSDDGQPEGALVFITNATERVLARQQAETMQAALLAVAQRRAQQREDLYQVFEQTPAAILLLRGPEHRVEYFNPAYAQLLQERVRHGLTLAEVQPEAIEQGLGRMLDQVYQTATPYYGSEQPVQLPQPGSQLAAARHFNFTYDVYREQGQVAGVSVFAFDVTEQVLARQQREAQQAELQRIFEHAPVAIAILRGPELVIELANASACAIWGRPAAQLLGRPYFEALPDMVGQGFEQILANVLASGTPLELNEVPVQILPDEASRPVLRSFNLAFHPLYNSAQRPAAVIVVGTDVSGQVEARQQVQVLNEELAAINEEMQATNEELHQSNVQLTHTNADLDNFIYTASHDLKAPIANIEGLVNALRQDLPAELLETGQVAKLLGLMDHSVQRFQQTLGHLTTISRLQQAGAGPTELVELQPLIEDVQLDLAPAFVAAEASLTVDVSECPIVRFAPKNLRSIIFNLLSNALKYRDPSRPAQVAVRASHAGERVEIAVQDNGLGLSSAQQAKLFGLFRRLHTHVEGSGVGLYVVKKIVENAGGTIRVTSVPGEGSTFTVTMPRQIGSDRNE